MARDYVANALKLLVSYTVAMLSVLACPTL